MKLKTAALAICLAIGSASLLSGCATSGGSASTPQAQPKLAVQYSSPAVEDELKRTGMQPAFMDYWQAHLDKDWSHRYALEKFPKPVEEKFYVAYHVNAWPIRLVQVSSVTVTEQGATVNVALTFSDPEKKKDFVQYQQTKWTLVDGAWRHMVVDPMLSGFSQ